MVIRIAFLILVAIFLFSCADQRNVPSEFVSRDVKVGDKTYKYRVLVPKDRKEREKLPVMLYLHGSGARGDDNIAQVDGFRWAIDPIKDNVGFIVVLPQCRDNTFWASKEMVDYSLAALDQTVKEFNGDPDRQYLAGYSLGGYGVWQIAAANPGKFAALVPVAGGVVGERPIAPTDRAAIIPEVGTMLDSPEPYKALASAIGKTPVWIFHGSADESVRVEFSRSIVKALAEAGNKNVKYTEYQGDGHAIFGKAIAEPGFLEWLGEQRRNSPQ